MSRSTRHEPNAAARHPSGVPRSLVAWTGLAAVTLAGGLALDGLGLPSGYLFAALLAGLALALGRPGLFTMPDGAFRVGQAVAGVAIGTYLQSSTITALGARWLPVALVSAATLGVTLGAGVLLERVAPVDRATASLGMVAGGASGIVAMARELGADDRLVAFMQYLRVLIVVLGTPILVALVFPGHGGGTTPSTDGTFGSWQGWLLTLVAAPLGAWMANKVRLPAGTLLGPLLLAGAITVSGLAGGHEVPPLLREGAFALIGLQIGLRFERETVQAIRALLVPVLLSILALLLACFGLAWVLTLTANVSLLNAYLATTPGGLYAVLPIAFGSGGDPTFVLAVQALRVFVMVLAAPAAVRVIVRRGRVPQASAARP